VKGQVQASDAQRKSGRAGVAERHIQNQSGHRSLPVLRGYIRRGSLFVDNAAAKVGL
jgi:hypothetical protein